MAQEEFDLVVEEEQKRVDAEKHRQMRRLGNAAGAASSADGNHDPHAAQAAPVTDDDMGESDSETDEEELEVADGVTGNLAAAAAPKHSARQSTAARAKAAARGRGRGRG